MTYYYINHDFKQPIHVCLWTCLIFPPIILLLMQMEKFECDRYHMLVMLVNLYAKLLK